MTRATDTTETHDTVPETCRLRDITLVTLPFVGTWPVLVLTWWTVAQWALTDDVDAWSVARTSALARVRDDRTDRFEAAALELGLMLTHQFLLPLLADNVSIQIFTDQVIYPRLWSGSMRIRTDSEINQIISCLQDWYWDPRILVNYTRSHHDSGVPSHHDADLLAGSRWDNDSRPSLIPVTGPSNTTVTPAVSVNPTKTSTKKTKKKTPHTKSPAKTPSYNFNHVLSISTPHEQKILRALKNIPVGTEVPAEIKGFPPNTVLIRHKHLHPGVLLKVITYTTSTTGKKTMRAVTTYLGYVKRIMT